MKHYINDIEKQRDHFMKLSAKWQKEYFEMKAERDNLIELLKMHRDAAVQIQVQQKEAAL